VEREYAKAPPRHGFAVGMSRIPGGPPPGPARDRHS